MAKLILNNSNFDTTVKEGVTLVDFFANWCGPCRALMPIIESIAEERTDIKVGAVNVDEQAELAQRFGIVSIPTLIIIKDGTVVNRTVGAKPKQQILSLIDSVL